MEEITYLIVRKKSTCTPINDILLKIAANKDVNFKGYSVGFVAAFSDLLYDHKDEVIEFMAEHGYAEFMNTVPMNESVVPKGATQPQVVTIMNTYLTKLGIDNELIIIDPYFLAPTRIPNYPQLIESILKNHFTNLETLRIITTCNTSKIDNSLLSSIESLLQSHKPTLKIIHNTSDNFHDRYWISNNRERAIVTGTSINGLGNKLALVDRVNNSDVKDIVNELKSSGLI